MVLQEYSTYDSDGNQLFKPKLEQSPLTSTAQGNMNVGEYLYRDAKVLLWFHHQFDKLFVFLCYIHEDDVCMYVCMYVLYFAAGSCRENED